MRDKKEAFYVVRRGDVIVVYKNLSDLQALLRAFIGEPAISVYKGITWLSNLKSIWLLMDSKMQCILWISVMFEMISLGYSCHALFGNLALRKIKFIGKNFQ
ncbi:hypothetical protein P3S67_018431 [Capsicum chacoense]